MSVRTGVAKTVRTSSHHIAPNGCGSQQRVVQVSNYARKNAPIRTAR